MVDILLTPKFINWFGSNLPNSSIFNHVNSKRKAWSDFLDLIMIEDSILYISGTKMEFIESVEDLDDYEIQSIFFKLTEVYGKIIFLNNNERLFLDNKNFCKLFCGENIKKIRLPHLPDSESFFEKFPELISNRNFKICQVQENNGITYLKKWKDIDNSNFINSSVVVCDNFLINKNFDNLFDILSVLYSKTNKEEKIYFTYIGSDLGKNDINYVFDKILDFFTSDLKFDEDKVNLTIVKSTDTKYLDSDRILNYHNRNIFTNTSVLNTEHGFDCFLNRNIIHYILDNLSIISLFGKHNEKKLNSSYYTEELKKIKKIVKGTEVKNVASNCERKNKLFDAL